MLRLIYFSPVFWSSFRQRPHFMAAHFIGRMGGRVLWVDPYPNRLPRLADLRRGGGIHNQRTEVPPGLTVVSPRALPIEPLPGGSWLNRHGPWRDAQRQITTFAIDANGDGGLIIGIGRPSRLALETLDSVAPPFSFFDAMDDFPEFYSGISRRSMDKVESAVAQRVNRIWASSSFLVDKFRQRGLGERVSAVFNAFDNANFGAPQQQRPQTPVLGYVGTISDWFDWGLVSRLASARPDCRVRLVGPVFTAVPADLPDNVELLPPCSQPEVEGHLEGFSVGLIPFQSNPLTCGVDPLKYYEYRAKGLGVLSTRFGEMALRGEQDGVFAADDGSDLGAMVERALAFRPSLEQLTGWRERNDWSARFGTAGLFGDTEMDNNHEQA